MAANDHQSARQVTPAQAPKSLRERFFAHVMGEKGLPSIGKELAYAVADIRQKLVEEATYGRAVTPDHIGSIHGRPDGKGEGDPLGRSAAGDPFRDRCRQAYAARQADTPERGERGPDR